MLEKQIEKKYHSLAPGSVRRVLALQASPRNETTSKTEILLQAFLSGCASAGAATETIYLRKKKIAQCTGCYTCWTKTPGVCIHKDDAADIMKQEDEADLVVYAYPLYHFGIISLLKRYIERTIPRANPQLIPRADGETTHPLREGFKDAHHAVIMGVCGFPEVSHFGAASLHLHYLANATGDKGLNIVAEIYRPASEVLNLPFCQEEIDRVLNATREAGRQVVERGVIDTRLIDEIAEVKLDIPLFREQANMAWDHCVKNGITLPEFQDQILGRKPR
jgi:multimeric flavodoxin WrbA